MSGYRLLSLLAVALCAAALMGLGRWALAPEQNPLPDGPLAMARAADAEAPAAEAKVDKALLDQLSWSSYVRTISSVYGTPRPDLLYTGEPLMVDVVLHNGTEEEVKLSGPFDAVVAESAWHLERTEEGKGKAIDVRVQAIRADKQVKIDTLPPGEKGKLWVRLSDIDQPGRYRLRFGPPWGRITAGEEWQSFELATPRTEVELMEFHRRKAIRARWAGQGDESERELRKLLKINPNSAGAYAEFAMLRESQKRYADATEYMEKAIKLAEAGADKFDNLSPHGREHWISGLEGLLKRLKEKAAE